jgi:hypothetical protein
VRTNHVHAIVETDIRPEKVMNDFKAHASRNLNLIGSDQPDRKRWAHHGSTRWLQNDTAVHDAIRYVIEGQGEPVAVYAAESL